LGIYREWKKIEFPPPSPKYYIRICETTRLRVRPRNKWHDEVREDGKLVGGNGWKEKVYNREEWKRLLRTARNRRISHKPVEYINEIFPTKYTVDLFSTADSLTP